MSTIRVLIVDDEPLAREGIRLLLESAADIEIAGEATDGPEAVAAIESLRPDLIFLDVQMPGMTGIEVLEQLDGGRIPEVIFVTAYDQYALRAFEHHALDYLLKPFDDDRFHDALAEARKRIRERGADRLGQRLLALLAEYRGGGKLPAAAAERASKEASPFARRLAVRSSGRIYFLRTEEIDWIEAADYYVKLHTGEREHLLRESMARLEESLDPRRFMRIHRSAIVNLDRIRELRPDANGESSVVLHDGTRLRLSRGKKEQLTAALSHS